MHQTVNIPVWYQLSIYSARVFVNKKKTGVLCGKIFKTYLKHSFEIFYISLHQHSLKTGVILKSKSRLNDCAMIYSPNSCHGDKRPPESFSNTFNKIGWKFFRVILWFLMNRKWNMANAFICQGLQLKMYSPILWPESAFIITLTHIGYLNVNFAKYPQRFFITQS